jgi:hypothetical protein
MAAVSAAIFLCAEAHLDAGSSQSSPDKKMAAASAAIFMIG